ncbi:MAG: ribonuclease J, partial [Clostridiales bacterium]|nr:ribonuclease J [Clostridiales bacterium]
TDFGRISRLGEEGVLLLLADSTNVEKNGFTPSEKTVGETFDKIFLSCKGRIIITSFASNVHRIQQAIWSAGKFGRKVAVVGRGMANVTAIAKELGYLDIPKDILIDVDEVNDLPANKVLILTTGSQGEPLSGLTRMSMGEHKQVHIMPGDLVIISATAIPGNERLVGRTIDNLFRQGAMVIHEKSDGIHVSGHASKEELKVLLNMVRPKFFMPIHGEYRMLIKHGRLAQQLGMSEKDIFVLENGQVLDVTKQRCQVEGTVPSGRILIDGLGVGDVGNTVLKDRRLLSQGGMVIISIVVDKKSGGVLAGPEFFSRGFIFEKENEHIINEVKEKAAAICAQNKNREEKDWHTVRGQLRNIISKTLFDRTGRRPIVLPLLTEV